MRRFPSAMAVLLLLAVTLSGVAAREPDRSAFQRVWERFDGPVASGAVQRTWFWGPTPRLEVEEPYLEAPGGTRLVQYWDKGRMEITNPNDDPQNPWYVTSGLLVREMISGKMQVGDEAYERRSPLNIPIAGDPYDNPDAPTYASFKGVASIENPSPGEVPFPFPYGPGINEENAALPRIGKFVAEVIDKGGSAERDPSLATSYPGTRIVYYDLEAGHNIPHVFWSFLQEQGLIKDGSSDAEDVLGNWIYLTGYPITEPYWVKTNLSGVERLVLVQAFERRVLTYNPLNPEGWQVEMGNTGLHYVMWRNTPVEVVEVPESINAVVDPVSGPGGTDFEVMLFGFQPGEEVDIWLTLPDQSVIPAVEVGVADEEGYATYFGDRLLTVFTWPGDPTGIWSVVGQGRESGNIAIAYFHVTE